MGGVTQPSTDMLWLLWEVPPSKKQRTVIEEKALDWWGDGVQMYTFHEGRMRRWLCFPCIYNTHFSFLPSVTSCHIHPLFSFQHWRFSALTYSVACGYVESKQKYPWVLDEDLAYFIAYLFKLTAFWMTSLREPPAPLFSLHKRNNNIYLAKRQAILLEEMLNELTYFFNL